MSENKNVIKCQNLEASYGSKKVLHDLSFEEEAGSWLGIVGPNGCGKTTLLKCINRALPYTGTLQLFDKNLQSYSLREIAQTQAFVRQNILSSFSLTALEVISLGLLPETGYLSELDKDGEHQIDELLESLGIAHLRDQSLDEMSGGEQRMIYLAQAIIQRPKLLLLDEPTVHLDPGRQYRFLDEVEKRRRDGLNVISVFHDINLACRYVNEIMIMQEGRVLAKGEPSACLTSENIKQIFGVNSELGKGSDGKLSVILYPL